MAGTKMSQFLEATELKNDDYVIILQDSNNKKIKANLIKSNSGDASSFVETLNVNDDDYIHIIQSGTSKKTKIKNIKGASNITEKYLELLGEDGNKYRVKMVNGKPYAYLAEADTASEPIEGDNVNYDGLIINQMYGGGTALLDTPISHSFIELYNLRPNQVNLKGLYLWVRGKSGVWKSLKLEGVVPPYHSFLIRCGEHNNINAECVIFPIINYDMSWDIKLPSTGFSCYLCIGDMEPTDNPVRQTVDAYGKVTSTNGFYIDMLGAGGEKEEETIWAYEKYYWHCMNNHTGVHRIDFANSGNINIGSNKKSLKNNQGDVEPLDYYKIDLSVYHPRCVADGKWTVYYDKSKFKSSCPSAINIAFGEDGNTSRTFSFQTPVSIEGYVRYRENNTNIWTTVETNREVIKQGDKQVTLHKVVVKNLSPGKTYEYQCGYEGCWSDIEIFNMKVLGDTDNLKVIWTSDQQGWGIEEYSAWETAAKNIIEWEGTNFDFCLNTGDISQNANRYFEWLDYYRFTRDYTRRMPHMITCGNNDLIQKKYSDAFAYYINAENQWNNSCHFWDLGYTHWVCLNSNTDYTYVEGDGKIGGYASTDAFLEAEANWLDAHLTEVEARETKPRWIIVYMHLSPFTCVRTKRCQVFVPVFEKHKVHLVLCGHNHCYTRSIPIYSGYTKGDKYNNYYNFTKKTSTTYIDETKMNNAISNNIGVNHSADETNGTVYIQCPATGYKFNGKETLISVFPEGINETYDKNTNKNGPWWQEYGYKMTQPGYIVMEISKEQINLTCYAINNTLVTDENNNIEVKKVGEQTKYQIDTTTITRE